MSRPPPGVAARLVALDVLERIEADGAYANIVLPATLASSDLGPADRNLATEMVYGTTRMRRALDHRFDRFLRRPVDDRVRAALRLGTYQLAYMRTPPHAAVSTTVGAVRGPGSGLVNAVLRKVAAGAEAHWPDDATRLSYPDWIVERLTTDLGSDDGHRALAAMNRPAPVTRRGDGYVQDVASQAVTALVDARPGEWVVDLCAAPGGKATGVATTASRVTAIELRPARAGLIVENRATLGLDHLDVVVADGTRPPLRSGRADAVLVDAPCSGLGALGSRPDARWRVEPAAVDRLVALQCSLVDAAAMLVRPGGRLVYSVCTLTAAERDDVADHVSRQHPGFATEPTPEPWTARGAGAVLLPQDSGGDGMTAIVWNRRR